MDCPTGMLVDIESTDNDQAIVENEAGKKDTPNTSGQPDLSTCKSSNDDTDSKKSNVKLCGYLLKTPSSGLIKAPKNRWFSYNPDTCELLYYRSPGHESHSNSPLGVISIRRASFNVTAANMKNNAFTITSNDVTHTLQADDQKTLLWWLQELQIQRRSFNARQSNKVAESPSWHGTMLGHSLFWVPNTTNTNPGLLDVCPEHKPETPVTDNNFNLNLVPRIDAPTTDNVESKPNKKRSATMMSNQGLSSLSHRFSSLGNLNAAFSNAGEAAMKGLRLQAQRLKPPAFGRRLSESSGDGEITRPLSASSSTGNLSNCVNEINFPAFIGGLKETVQNLQQELNLLKNKLQTKEEVIEVLKLELQKHEEIKAQRLKNQGFSRDDYKLRSEVISLKMENERLEQEKGDGKKREEELLERISMLEEMLKVKDEVVVQLSNEMYELEASHKELLGNHDQLRAEKNEEFIVLTPVEAEESASEMKDRLDGYMLQNNLLNSEILELANLRQMDAQRLQQLVDKVQHQEAEHCQLHSKYLVLLSEMNKPRSESVGLAVAGTKLETSDTDRKEMMKILIKDALSDAEIKSTAEESDKQSRYDQYGFNNLLEDDAESTLLAAASRMEKRSTDILHSLNQYNISVAVKWQNYLTINKEFQRGDDFKALIRLGVPHELRPQVWSWIVNARTAHIRQKLEFDNSYYYQLVHSKEAQLPSKQIELDLLRTLPNNKHFSSLSSSGIDQLRRVLRAYSIHNPSIGYCQGLNRIVAVALLYLCEEDAFWCLVAVVECIMPQDYYSTTLTASQADQRVFRDLMAEKLPRLHRHLEVEGVDTSLITFNWLLCIYCDNVPPETMLHIWDCLLNEGSKVLFRYGLAFFKYVEEEILQLHDYMSIFNFLRIMSHRMHDVRELTNIAFPGMNPFPMKKITRLRQIHMEKVNAELKELDNLRKGFASVRKDVARRELDSDDD